MIELHIEGIDANVVESFTDRLLEWGALSITLLDAHDCPVLEPAPGETPLWPEVKINALFEDETQLALCSALIQSFFISAQLSSHPLENKDWENQWKAESKPMCFGERLWVYPSHIPLSPEHAHSLILDPGLAFGTGTHPTTSLCLKWLDTAKLEGKTLIDYGCGSGILMIAALKCGAQFAYGVDIDPQAIQASEQNAKLNALRQSVYALSLPNPNPPLPKVELILANILLNPLIALKDHFHEQLKPKGTLVVSGILNEQLPSLIHAYKDTFKCIETQTQAQWSMATFKLM